MTVAAVTSEPCKPTQSFKSDRPLSRCYHLSPPFSPLISLVMITPTLILLSLLGTSVSAVPTPVLTSQPKCDDIHVYLGSHRDYM